MQENKIRILHLIKSLEPGGIERSTVLYSNILAGNFEWIGILAAKGFYDREGFVNPPVKIINPRMSFSINPYNILVLSARVCKLISQNKISIIHYHHRICLPVVFVIKIFFPSVKVCYTHHSNFNDWINNLLKADKFVAVSKITENDLLKYGKKNISLIKHGVAPHDSREGRIKRENPVIGFIGRFVKGKNIEDILNSYLILACRGFRGSLLLTGCGPMKKQIENFILKNRFQGKINIKGPVINTSEILNEIDILVSASSNLEGFGLNIIEAAAYGVPVIASKIEAYKEIIKDGENGLLYEPGNFRELSDKIMQICSDESLYRKISLNSIKRINHMYNLTETINSYQRLYSENGKQWEQK